MMQNNKSINDKILLFIPGYNCEKQVTRVLNQLNSEVLSYISKVIMVNNRSTDNTEKAVMEYGDSHKNINLSLIRNDDNYSLGGSHKVAFEYAISNGFDYVIVLHGDDQGNIHDLLPILKSGEYKKHDSCLGSRFMKGSNNKGYSTIRTLANLGLNLWFSIVSGKIIKDLGSGLNIYKVENLKTRYYKKYPDKLSFNVLMVLATAFYKQDIHFFPISWREDDQVSNVKLFSFGCGLLKISFSYLFGRKKFMLKETREKIIDNYTYKIVYENN